MAVPLGEMLQMSAAAGGREGSLRRLLGRGACDGHAAEANSTSTEESGAEALQLRPGYVTLGPSAESDVTFLHLYLVLIPLPAEALKPSVLPQARASA